MFLNPELTKMLMDERQRSIVRAIHLRPAPHGLPSAPKVQARPVGPPAYYRGIAVAVWRAALLRRSSAGAAAYGCAAC
jgi:hypothetical protein